MKRRELGQGVACDKCRKAASHFYRDQVAGRLLAMCGGHSKKVEQMMSICRAYGNPSAFEALTEQEWLVGKVHEA